MYFSDEINFNNKNDIEEIKEYLKINHVDYNLPDKTFVIRDNGKIIGTGSADGNILKYFFSKDEYQGQGLMGIIYNSLLNYLFEIGFNSFFVFTLPCNKDIFKSLGLKEVYSTNRVSLFEGGFYNYGKWINEVKKSINEKNGIRGSIVVNCNPMTLGHKYLIEKALEKVDDLLVFVVEEDSSIFPFKDRYNIVKDELKDYKNIFVIKGGPYIISRGTFPTYFIKKKDEMLDIYTELDGSIFAKKIALDLEIDLRFFGEEPIDIVTLNYNNTLKSILEDNLISVEIIKRKELDNIIISASYVRELLRQGNIQQAFNFLPRQTIEYLESPEGKKIIDKLRDNK